MMQQQQSEARTKYIDNFPFPNLRQNQAHVLGQIEDAFASGYRYICLEAAVGFELRHQKAVIHNPIKNTE